MLDKPTKDKEPAPGWRFRRFLRFGDDGGETARPKATKPPKSQRSESTTSPSGTSLRPSLA